MIALIEIFDGIGPKSFCPILSRCHLQRTRPAPRSQTCTDLGQPYSLLWSVQSRLQCQITRASIKATEICLYWWQPKSFAASAARLEPPCSNTSNVPRTPAGLANYRPNKMDFLQMECIGIVFVVQNCQDWPRTCRTRKVFRLFRSCSLHFTVVVWRMLWTTVWR